MKSLALLVTIAALFAVGCTTSSPVGPEPSLRATDAAAAASRQRGGSLSTSGPTGEGAVSAITRPGPLSTFGSIAACALTGEFEWHVVGAYHIDGQSHGPTLGPAGSAVEQFGFVSKS